MLVRVMGEFLEIPGLRLKVEQAQRLWGLDRATCEDLLGALVSANVLRVHRGEAYGLPEVV